jgi:hypothetical protein
MKRRGTAARQTEAQQSGFGLERKSKEENFALTKLYPLSIAF